MKSFELSCSTKRSDCTRQHSACLHLSSAIAMRCYRRLLTRGSAVTSNVLVSALLESCFTTKDSSSIVFVTSQLKQRALRVGESFCSTGMSEIPVRSGVEARRRPSTAYAIARRSYSNTSTLNGNRRARSCKRWETVQCRSVCCTKFVRRFSNWTLGRQ